MTTHNLDQGFGLGEYKFQEGTASLANGDTITAANMSSIISAVLTAETTTGNYVVCGQSISGSVVTVFLAGAASGTAPSTITAKTNVHYHIIGE